MKKIYLTTIAFCVAAMVATSAFAETIPSGPYFIKSVKSGTRKWKGAWDVPGTPRRFKKGQNIKVWEVTRQDSRRSDRYFYIMKERNGYYSIRSGLSMAAYVNVDGNRTKNGTNIELWSRKSGRSADAQRFRFVHLGGGKYKIYTKSGKVICLAGRSDRNGTNVHIWDNHSGPWCEWYLVKKNSRQIYQPRRSSSITNNGSNSGTDVTLDQVFRMSNNDYRADMYFKKVDYSKLRNENNKKSISSRLNRLDETKALNMIMKIVDNTSGNRSSSTRRIIYKEINNVNFKRIKKSFVNRLLAAGVKKNVKKVYKKERDYRCKAELKKIMSSL